MMISAIVTVLSGLSPTVTRPTVLLTNTVLSRLSPTATRPTVLLTNTANADVRMPAAGLGTGCNIGGCTISPGSDMVALNMSLSWLAIGGRRFDAADSYGCEPGIGLALKRSGVRREDVFLTSKTGPGGLSWPLGFNETLSQGRAIVQNYSVSQIDLLLIHWPVNWGPCKYKKQSNSIPTTDPSCDSALPTFNATECRLSTWRAMLELWRVNVTRAIGVSNYGIAALKEIETAGLPLPSVNQFKFNPTHGPSTANCVCEANELPTPLPCSETCGELLAWMSAHGIVANGYSPFGGKTDAQALLSDPRLVSIADAHNVSAAQVVLAWQFRSHGVVVNPEATSPAYQAENLNFGDVHLTTAESAVLDGWKV